MIPRLSTEVGDDLRTIRPLYARGKQGYRSLYLILLLTSVIFTSIILSSVALSGTGSISANCYDCHTPSIFLIVEIHLIDVPIMIETNVSTQVNVTIEVSGSHKSYVWSGFGMDAWISAGADHTDCGPHQISNGQKPSGSSSPYTWKRTYSFLINSSLAGQETFTVNARMSPIHESPPVTAQDTFFILIVDSMNGTAPPLNNDPGITGVLEDAKEGRELGKVGLTIVIMGGTAVLAGILYAGYSLFAPVQRKGKNGGQEE